MTAPQLASADAQRTRPPRVLHLVHWLNQGGVETWLLTMLQSISRADLQLDVCCQGGSEGELAPVARSAGARVHHCPLHPTILPFTRRLKKILLDDDYDILHAHTNVHCGAAVWAANAARIPVITTYHNMTFPPETKWTRLPGIRNARSVYASVSMRYALQNSTTSTGVSQAVVRGVEAKAGVRDSGCQVFYLGVRQPSPLAEEARAHYYGELQIDAESPTIIHVGSFTDRKNHIGLLRVFRGIVDVFPTATLLLVGDGPLRNRIKQETNRLRLEQQVRILGVRTDATALMQIADLLVFPSVTEGLSIVLMEANALGLPIVGSSISANQEATADGTAARLHSVDNLDAMTASAIDLLKNPMGAQQMARQARSFYEETFSVDASIERMKNLYAQVLAKHSHAPALSGRAA